MVCLSVIFMHCAQSSNGIRYWQEFVLHTTTPYLSQIALKIWLTSINIFLPKVTHPCHPVDLSVRHIRWQIAAEWLEIAQWSQWRAYRNPPSLFRMVPSLTFYNFPFPKTGSQMHPHYQLHDACCHLGNMMEDIDKLYDVPDVIISPAMSSFAKSVWPLLNSSPNKSALSVLCHLFIHHNAKVASTRSLPGCCWPQEISPNRSALSPAHRIDTWHRVPECTFVFSSCQRQQVPKYRWVTCTEWWVYTVSKLTK